MKQNIEHRVNRIESDISDIKDILNKMVGMDDDQDTIDEDFENVVYLSPEQVAVMLHFIDGLLDGARCNVIRCRQFGNNTPNTLRARAHVDALLDLRHLFMSNASAA